MVEELNMIYEELANSNAQTLSHYEAELVKIRAGKASPSMLQSVMVDYYGTMTPLSQVSNINTLDARTITIQPWEKSLLDEIMTGIVNANLGFAPQNNGESVLISVPPLTEERRKEFVKRAKAESENAKVGIRNNRKDALDVVKELKNDGLSEDMMKDAENEIQSTTNSFNSKIDALFEVKEKDIMTI